MILVYELLPIEKSWSILGSLKRKSMSLPLEFVENSGYIGCTVKVAEQLLSRLKITAPDEDGSRFFPKDPVKLRKRRSRTGLLSTRRYCALALGTN